jgi:hypothetical protein
MVPGSADGDYAEKPSGHDELDSIGVHDERPFGGCELQRRRCGSVAANMRPKVLEDAAALSMVAMMADRATVNSADATKGEEQATNKMRR